MNLFRLFVCSAILVTATSAHAQNTTIGACQHVLIPTEEQAQSDYRRMQAHMYSNAEYEYERLSKMDAESRNADASYKVFSAAYNDAKSKEEFSQKVRQKLVTEGFNLQESEARSHARRGLTDQQIKGWSDCIANLGGAGAILLTPRGVTQQGFNLRVERIFPKGVGGGEIKIAVTNGTIDGKPALSEQYAGAGGKTYRVNVGDQGAAVTVIANLSGMTDDLSVDLKPYVPIQLPKSQVVLASGFLESTNGNRQALTRRVVPSSFTVPANERIKTFRVVIEQEVNGKVCASAVLEPGAMNFPPGTTLSINRRYRDQMWAGCQVPASYMQVQCFVDEREPLQCR